MTNQPSLFKKKNPKRKIAGRPAPQDRHDLQVEIDTLRHDIDCLSQLIDPEGPIDVQLRLLDGLGKGAIRLAALIKAQREMVQSSDDYLAGLRRLVVETTAKLRRDGVHE
jgi:hypothetical protein